MWWVIVRSIATRVRVAGLGLLGAAAVALGIAVRLAQPANRPNAAWTLVDGYGLSLLIPVVALVLASDASLGDLGDGLVAAGAGLPLALATSSPIRSLLMLRGDGAAVATGCLWRGRVAMASLMAGWCCWCRR